MHAIRGNDTHPTETPIKKTADIARSGFLGPRLLATSKQATSPEIVEWFHTLQMRVVISFVGSSDLIKFSEQLYAFTENGLTMDKMSQVLKSQSYNQICWRGPGSNGCCALYSETGEIYSGTFVESHNGMIDINPIGCNAS
ncbi:hypothetical protein B0H17DRAFT_1140904 [Mycena rosella]|uniref:Uncharacterized protein n=1 Tax=Mycena rosella TaxID=1033263 RepID=A0AAD7D145_MYCRO|nr:hypothetical protein B0H17DRAFT_1140904 [Mycena rosella]